MAKLKSARSRRPVRASRSPSRKTRAKAQRPVVLSPEEASRVVKRAAAGQRIVISLTEEQFEQLTRNFKPDGGSKFDPRRPFQIDFECGSVAKSRLPVASCAFWSDTCCA